MTTPQVSNVIRWLDESVGRWTLGTAAAAGGPGVPSWIGGSGLVALAAIWALGAAWLTARRWQQWRAISRLARCARRLEHGREVDTLGRVARSAARPRAIEILECHSNLEPGVLGIVRPKLLWPAGLSDRLSDSELAAIVSHEACHVDRGDNLSAVIQMVVETAFWFHPVVWWLGARLVNERERACDEEVLRMGTDTRSYAESILKVCGFYLRSPVAFVAGVGGSNLNARIERIVSRPVATSLSLRARMLVAGVALATVGTPVMAGVLSTAVANQERPKAYRPGNGVTHPKLVKETKPRYTREAMDAKIQGTVWLQAIVLDNGDVGDVEVIQSLDQVYGLDDEAVKALKQWKFEPGMKDGKPVDVQIEVEMSFRLK
jgi:TonB family protein